MTKRYPLFLIALWQSWPANVVPFIITQVSMQANDLCSGRVKHLKLTWSFQRASDVLLAGGLQGVPMGVSLPVGKGQACDPHGNKRYSATVWFPVIYLHRTHLLQDSKPGSAGWEQRGCLPSFLPLWLSLASVDRGKERGVL